MVLLDGVTPTGEHARRHVRVCGPAAFVVLKVLALRLRGDNKDAYDLVYVLENFGEGVLDVVRRFAPLMGIAETRLMLGYLAEDFASSEPLGPKRHANFIAGADDASLQAEAFGHVATLVDALRATDPPRRLPPPRAPKAAKAPRTRRRKLVDALQADRRHRREEDLRDALATLDHEGLVAEVDEGHHQLAAVVTVDRSGAVDQRDAVLEGEPRTGTDLPFPVRRDGEGDPARDEPALAGRDRHRGVLGEGRAEVEARGAFGGPRGEGKALAVMQHLHLDERQRLVVHGYGA